MGTGTKDDQSEREDEVFAVLAVGKAQIGQRRPQPQCQRQGIVEGGDVVDGLEAADADQEEETGDQTQTPIAVQVIDEPGQHWGGAVVQAEF